MKYIVLILLFLFNLHLCAQVNDNLLRTEEASGGIRLNTQGWTIYGERGKNVTYYKKIIYQFELGEYKHPKQAKQSVNTSLTSNSRPYFFGKQNNFYILHANIGVRRHIGEKAEKSGVEVNYVYMGGATLGILKPYFINVVSKDNNAPFESIQYTGLNEEQFLDWSGIYGASGFTKGVGKSKLLPGLHGKLGLNFDWSSYSDLLKSIEVGLALDVFYKKVPLMVTQKNSFYFLNLYLSAQLGRKWY